MDNFFQELRLALTALACFLSAVTLPGLVFMVLARKEIAEVFSDLFRK